MKQIISLSFLLVPLISFSQSKYQLIIQNINNCGEQEQIDVKLNWYCLLQTDSGEYLVKIDPVLKHPAVGEIIEEEGPFNLKYPYNETLFILGTDKLLREVCVSKHHTPINQNFYPGQSTYLYVRSKNPQSGTWILKALGCVEVNKPLTDYQLIIAKDDRYTNYIDLTPSFDYLGEMGMPNLMWFGDIDGDHKPDLLFSCSSTSQNQYSLYLSSESKHFAKKVATYDLGNCY